MRRLERHQRLPGSPAEVFPFFADALNLERITPPWLGFRVLAPGPIEMGPGTLIEYRLRLRGVPVRWLTRIEVWEPPHRFVDLQQRGPYRAWRHEHAFDALDGATLVRDRVDYELPLGALGGAAHALFVRRELGRIFDYRAASLAAHFTK
ncbi:MAG TPA: SRPBCC family protein [Thermoleophilaceae bacterium]